jgi:hypothetical protein
LKTTKPRLFLIFWQDAQPAEEEPEGEIGADCYDIGWLVREDARGMRLAREWEPADGSFRFFIDIPRDMIYWAKEIRWSLKTPAG